jgi:hypothetical protein
MKPTNAFDPDWLIVQFSPMMSRHKPPERTSLVFSMSRSLNSPKPTESREVSPTNDHYYISGLSGLDRADAAPRSIINHLVRSWSSSADHGGLQWNRHCWLNSAQEINPVSVLKSMQLCYLK